MYSDRVKFHVALPEKEYRGRDVTIPSEATKTLYDIDVQQGHDKGICLAILGSVFRGNDSITKILQESIKDFQVAQPLEVPWKSRAVLNRKVKATAYTQKLKIVGKQIEKAT